VIESIGARHGAMVNQVVLSYLLSQPLPTIPIVGPSRPEQVAESASACSLRLGAEELEDLRRA
jgi:aryl-alcohol dehydrogenase-like predicted oxidoreductase